MLKQKTKQRLSSLQILAGLLLLAGANLSPALAQTPSGGAAIIGDNLPKDVFPDSRSRLPLKNGQTARPADDAAPASGAPQALAAIRLHASGANVRWSSPLGRQLTELTIIATGREFDQPYEWSLHEMEAVSWGLDPAVIDLVRYRKPLTGLDPKEAVVVQIARELAGTHKLSSATYARGLNLLGESNLVDIVSLVSMYVSTAARLTAFNQQMPAGMKQFLPLPFTLPDDIYPDTRSRLPWATPKPEVPPQLYAREIAPTGTGPFQLALHQGSLKSLQAHVEPRLLDLAVLVTDREFDQQYEWTLNEITARKDGLEPAIIDLVRDRKPAAGLGEKETAIITFGRELFGKHVVAAQTYARALKAFGETDLVDLVNLMTQHASNDALLTGFDQHLPAGQASLLPIP
jgi:4-carboxymuconolactone decarboxylase